MTSATASPPPKGHLLTLAPWTLRFQHVILGAHKYSVYSEIESQYSKDVGLVRRTGFAVS